MPKFSIIIPNYNHGRYLAIRITSILNQTFTDYELIIIDDNSTDNSREIIEEYKNNPHVVKVVYNSINSGSPFLQWKKGIELAKADWIWIAESDDAAEPGFLQAADAAIQKYPSTDLFYTDGVILDEEGNQKLPGKYSIVKNNFLSTDKWSKEYHQDGTSEMNECLKYFCSINNASSTVIKKTLLLPLLQDLSSFQLHGDWFCYIHLALKGNITYVPAALSLVRNYPGSLLNYNQNILKSKSEYFRILLLIMKQENVADKKKVIQFFSEHYLSFGLIKDGVIPGCKIMAQYLRNDFFTGLKVLRIIFSQKITRKKIKPVF